jgi:hypothetical protein
MNGASDYEKMLADLLEERANLDRMIAWVKLRLGRTDADQAEMPASGPRASEPSKFGRLATDAFFRMSVSEAVKAYLAFAKKPQTAREITDALIAGGLTFKAKNLYQTVFPTLTRMASEGGDVAKLKNNTWGLAEWYSAGRRTVVASTAEGGEA